MQRLTLNFCPHSGSPAHSMDVPDIVTALVVADINLDSGEAEIFESGRRVARLRKLGRERTPFWLVG